jgi:serine/threonine protein kinase
MWKNQTTGLEEIGIAGIYHLEDIPGISLDILPLYNEKTHTLQFPSGKGRAQFTDEKALAHGSYGNLFFTVRNVGMQQQAVLLKQPRMAEMTLFQEGVLQYVAQKTAEMNGIGWCVPKVYDVFWRKKEVWFSMEYIVGISVLDWFHRKEAGDLDFFFLIAQLCLYLACLETHLGLDHRDLKLDNLILKQQPCDIHITIKDKVWTLQSPFTVVILDFGFACLGSKEIRGKPIVNLGDGILPPMDPCPKEGRDLFQLLTSILRYETLIKKLSPHVLKKIDEWLSIGQKSYGPMARRWSTENWTYLVASQRDFAIPSCCPLNILQSILTDLHGYLTVL